MASERQERFTERTNWAISIRNQPACLTKSADTNSDSTRSCKVYIQRRSRNYPANLRGDYPANLRGDYPANLRGKSAHKISRGNCGIEHRFPWGFERPQGNRDLQRPRSSARRNRDQAVLRVAPGVCTSAARAKAAAQQCTRATGSSPCSRNTSGSFTRCLTATAQSDRHTSSGCSITRVLS